MDILNRVLSEQLNFLRDNPILVGLTLAGMLIAIVLIFILSFRSQRLSERAVVLLLCVAFGLLMLNYFFPGDFVRGDGPLHIARAWLTLDSINAGEWPIWSNRVYFGSTGEMYYGNLSFLVFALTSKFSGMDIFSATKVILWVLHVASGVFVYLYARGRLNRALSIFAAIAYVLSWQHFGVVRRFGILPLAFIYFLIPLFFLLIDSYLKKRVTLMFASIAGGILCALAVMSHMQYGTYLCATYFIVLMWIGLVNAFYRDWRELRGIITLFISTGIAAALLGGWFAVPLAVERGYLPSTPEVFGAWSMSGMIDATLSISLITRLLDSWGQGYIGLSILIPAVIGVVVVARRLIIRKNLSQKMLIWGYPLGIVAIGFFLLDPLKRYTGIWFFFVCIAAAYGVKWTIERLASMPTRTLRLQQLATLLIILEMGPALLLVGDYLEMDAVNRQVANLQTEITASGVPGRIMVFKPDKGVFWRPQDTMFTGASVVFGGQLQASTQTHDYMAAITDQIATEVYDNEGKPSPELLNLLRLMNVRYVLMNDEDYFEVPDTSPVIFAPTIQVTDAHDPNGTMGMNVNEAYENRDIQTTYVDTIADEMGLKPGRPDADAILVNQPIDDAQTAAGGCTTDQPFSFNSGVERHTSFDFTYDSLCSGYVRLAYAYFPLLKLEVDGVETSFYPDALNMVVFRAPEGAHQIRLIADISPLRKVWLIATGLTIVVLLIYALFRLLARRSQYTAHPKALQGVS